MNSNKTAAAQLRKSIGNQTSKSEYTAQFERKSGELRVGRPHETNLKTGQGKFDDSTESRTALVAHALPKKFITPKATYVPNEAPLGNDTTSRHDYIVWPAAHTKPIKPSQNIAETGKFQAISTSKADYAFNGKVDPVFRKPVAVYVKNEAKFQGISTNMADFRKNEIIRRSIGGPHQNNLKVGGSFTGETENHAHYTQHVIPKKFQMAKREYIKNPAKLDGVSTNKHDFKANPVVMRTLGGPHQNNLKVGGNFSGNSESHEQFVKHLMPERFKMAKREYVQNPAKLDGESTNRHDFKANPVVMRTLGGPHQNNLKVGGNFTGSTESNSQYTIHKIPSKFQMPPRQYVKNVAKLDGVSTNMNDYKTWDLGALGRVKGQGKCDNLKACPSGARLDGKSEYHQEFTQKAMPSRILVKPPSHKTSI